MAKNTKTNSGAQQIRCRPYHALHTAVLGKTLAQPVGMVAFVGGSAFDFIQPCQ